MRGELSGSPKTCMDAISTDESEDLEDPWAYRFSRHSHPNRVNQRSGFHIADLSRSSQDLFS